ncbi:MAG: hypothetical protein KU29_08480 [Sulfurovum sp. FS06-10]|jgi:hypothetical protein|nr:MAG: hypothetical protein KU29_08480 [Sulfurovum sp. FS06-10]
MLKKIIFWNFLVVGIFMLGGCSYFTFNAAICDQIASDPHATIPKECRNYNEKDAEKAFNKPSHKLDINDTIEFNNN